jgi:HAD superfamily 5'-nucleotidase-like hydrolase
MRSITAVGFDMDYTLAQYVPETFEDLAYTQACGKLVSNLAYPPEVLQFKYDCNYMLRGLAVDKARGNVLKMDRHKYVKLAFHGFKELPRAERLASYADSARRESFDEPDFALLDTLFSLGETYLYCQLVELKDGGCAALAGKSYARMHADVRNAVDMCHRDGSLKAVVAADPARYIYADSSLVPLLRTLRASGRQTFLVTNSLWDYTNVVMNFLVGGLVGDAKTLEWTRHFDVIITGSCKPRFFENEREPIYAIEPHSGALLNTDNGAPLPYIGGSDPLTVRPFLQLGQPQALQPLSAQSGCAAKLVGRLFQGGCYRQLHSLLRVSSGSKVLYVGDHIYGDILRSKKTLGWRTALIVPELAAELNVQSGAEARQAQAHFKALRAKRDALDDELQRLEWARKVGGARAVAAAQSQSACDSAQTPPDEAGALLALGRRSEELRKERDALRELHRAELRAHHAQFHPTWGQLLKTGYTNSRFASQVERFACLYTSHIGNLLAYSPEKSYRAAEDQLAHENI